MAHVFDAIAAHYGPLRLPKGYLKRYQRRGIPTLVSKLCSMGTALLADEMGLGKTIQGVLTALGFAALGGGGPVLLHWTLGGPWFREQRSMGGPLAAEWFGARDDAMGLWD